MWFLNMMNRIGLNSGEFSQSNTNVVTDCPLWMEEQETLESLVPIKKSIVESRHDSKS